MSHEKYYIYTDASYSHLQALAVSGFLVYEGTETHEKGQMPAAGIRTFIFKESNNIRAEIIGALHALNTFSQEKLKEKTSIKNIEINLFSDCQTLTNLLARREKLVATNYISARKKTTLANADLYKTFFSVYDELKPQIHWVPGHFKKATLNSIQKNFSLVDKQVRKELRTLVKPPPQKTKPI